MKDRFVEMRREVFDDCRCQASRIAKLRAQFSPAPTDLEAAPENCTERRGRKAWDCPPLRHCRKRRKD
ncbi:Sulfatase [Novosphingobium sp. PY1]|nr:Sulfatase [Novosphingobium sp. PY1]GFM31345.1 Sulfatase [Novosphingobium sp. PY1]